VERACQSQGAEACLFEVMPVTQVYAGTSDQAVDPVLCLPDATMVATEQHVLETRLKEQTAVLLQANKLLQSQIIERQRVEEVLQETQRILSTLMSNLPGMAYRCRNQDDWMMEFVSEGCLDLTGYQPADLLYNTVVSYASLIHPDDRADVFKTIQEALDAQRPFRCTYRIITATGAEKWVWEQGRGVVSPTGTWMIEGFIIDNTERMRAYHSLEQRVTERTQELGRRREVAEGLRGILTVLNSNRSLEEILTYIVAQACRLLGTNAGAIYRLEGDMLTIQAYQGLPAVYADVKLPFDWGATGKAVAQRQPVAISDTQKFLTTLDSSVIAPHHRPLMVQVMQQFQSLLAVPLVIKEEVYGGITIYHTDIHEFTAEEIDLAVSFADQAALGNRECAPA
jgi:Transcriptional regulator containing GAF, AAA-type ATPase, and DNA binding domains